MENAGKKPKGIGYGDINNTGLMVAPEKKEQKSNSSNAYESE